jgi:homocysteine S-methyltransferase
LKIIRRKLESGADFVLTQPIYAVEPLKNFLEAYHSAFGQFPIPIIAGVLPLVSARHAAFLQQEVPGIDIPGHVQQMMQKAGDAGARTGIELSVQLIGELKELAQGVYLMPPFNRFDYAAEIIENCSL